jgi:two-component system, NtrC family, sensor kinase
MRVLSRLAFRTKIELAIGILVMGTALLLALAAGRTAADALNVEHRKRGLALSEILAARTIDPLLARDLLRLKNIVDDLKRIEGDVLYAFIQDEKGHVLVHTFPGGFPDDLLLANVIDDHVGTKVQLLSSHGELLDDFAASVSAGTEPIGTARVGISRTKIQSEVDRLFLVLMLIATGILVAALSGGTLFARRISSRLNRLRSHAWQVVQGNLELHAGPDQPSGCWEIMSCSRTDCPAYGDNMRRCWYLAGTKCQECKDVDFPEKLASCRNCTVYKANVGDEIQDLAETFDVMALSLKHHIEGLKSAERRVVDQQQLLRTVLDVTPDMVSLMDQNLVYKAVNKAFAEFVGIRSEELIGRTDQDIFPQSVADAKDQENRRIFSLRKGIKGEISIKGEGGERWLHVVKVPVHNQSGEVIGILHTARDVTEIRRYQDQLIQSQKMESIGKLAGGVAHEINTPLGIILGYAQILLEETEQEKQYHADLKIIEKQAKVCRKIVSDLLGFSRQHEHQIEEMDLNHSILEAVSLVRHTFSLNGVEIITELDEELPPLMGDREKFMQVWMNLLDNALDAMPLGGAITIRSRLNNSIRVSFADTGTGISAENLKKIFDPFYSTKEVGKGTGLGLSVSFGIIEGHGGKVWAVSPCPSEYYNERVDRIFHQGAGTVFLIDLPIPKENEAMEDEKMREGPGKSEHVGAEETTHEEDKWPS